MIRTDDKKERGKVCDTDGDIRNRYVQNFEGCEHLWQVTVYGRMKVYMKQGWQKQSNSMWIRLNWHRIGNSNELLCIQQLNFWYHETKVKVNSLSTLSPRNAPEAFWRSREREQLFSFPGFENRTVQPVA